MRKLLFILSFVIAATSAAFGQTDADQWVSLKTESGKHESYITNDWFDNWYIGIGGGALTSFSKMTDPRFTPEFEANVLKWFTPAIGIRLGYMGQWGKEYIKTSYNPSAINHSALPFDGKIGGPGTLSYNMFYTHGNLLWNITNTIGGYKYNRIFNVSPYVNFGWLRMYDPANKDAHDNEIGFGGGLYNTVRLGERVVLTIDVRHINTASRYKTREGIRTNFVSASVGVAYNIFRTYWNRTSTMVKEVTEAKAEAEAAMAAVKEKENEVKVLEEKIAEMKNEPALPAAVWQQIEETGAVQVIYFAINESKLTKTEKLHLADFVKEQLAKNPEANFNLTGSADMSTGPVEFNEKLSLARAQEVKSILTDKYGVSPDHIAIANRLSSDASDEAAFSRCVVIEIR